MERDILAKATAWFARRSAQSRCPPTTTGPVRFDWLQAVAQIAGRSKALYVAVLLAWLAARSGRPCVAVAGRLRRCAAPAPGAQAGAGLVGARTRTRRRANGAGQRHALDPLLTKRTPNGFVAVRGVGTRRAVLPVCLRSVRSQRATGLDGAGNGLFEVPTRPTPFKAKRFLTSTLPDLKIGALRSTEIRVCRS